MILKLIKDLNKSVEESCTTEDTKATEPEVEESETEKETNTEENKN